MKITKTALPGVVIIEPQVFEDERGSFSESFSEHDLAAALARVNITLPHFVQDNESRSGRGVVRGLHFQRSPHRQAKLVRVAAGSVMDVAVDVRPSSPTFGRWVAVELSADNRRQLFIPRGFAHGFGVTDGEAVVIYKVDDYYAPESEAGVLWCDPALGIDWGVDPGSAIVSAKDAAWPKFKDL